MALRWLVAWLFGPEHGHWLPRLQHERDQRQPAPWQLQLAETRVPPAGLVTGIARPGSRPELSPRYMLIVDREKALDTLCLQVELHHQTAQNWKEISEASETSKLKKKLKSEIEKLLKDMLFIAANVELMPPGSLISAEAKSIRVIDRRKTGRHD